jgi:hypothetical protein
MKPKMILLIICIAYLIGFFVAMKKTDSYDLIPRLAISLCWPFVLGYLVLKWKQIV